MLLYIFFSLFSEVMDQIFLTIWVVVQSSFRATLGVASVFVYVVSRLGLRALRCFSLPSVFFLRCN